MHERGRNAGITGAIIDLQDNPAFVGKAYGFERALSVGTINVAGRGDDLWGDVRPVSAAGTLIVTAIVQAGLGYPMPNVWRGQTGDVRLQYGENADEQPITETIPVRVIGHAVWQDEKTKDNWHVKLMCQVTDDLTHANFAGAQPTPGEQSFSDKEVYEGLSKVYDPNNLQDGATQRFLIWPLGDTDEAEEAELIAFAVAAADPLDRGLKARTFGLTRLNFLAGFIAITWGLRSTKDDEKMPRSFADVDPENITSAAAVAEVNGTPGAPLAGSGWVETSTTTSKLHDTATLSLKRSALRTSKDAVQMDGTFYVADVSDLESQGQQTVVFDTGDAVPAATNPAPGDVQVTSQNVIEINRLRKKVVYGFAKDTSQQRAEQENTFTTLDSSELEDHGQVAGVDLPQPIPSGYQENGLVERKLTHDHVLYISKWSRTTSAQRVEFPRTKTLDDPHNIEDFKSTAQVYGNLGAPSPAAPPPGLQLANSYIVPHTNDHSVQHHEYARLTSRDKLVLPHTWTSTDDSAIASEGERAAMDGETAIPASIADDNGVTLQLRDAQLKQITHPSYGNRTLTLGKYGVRTHAQDELFPRIKTSGDPAFIEDEAFRAEFWDSAGIPPTFPSDPPTNNVKLIAYTDLVHTPQRNIRLWVYGTRTSSDKLILQHHETRTDASGLKSVAIRAGLDGDTIIDPPGFVLRETLVVPVTIGLVTPRTLTVKIYGLLTRAQEIELEATEASADPFGEDERHTASIVTVNDTVTAAAHADALFAANRTDAMFRKAVVKKLLPTKVLEIVHKAGGDKLWIPGGNHVHLDALRGRPTVGWGNPEAELLVISSMPPVIGGGGLGGSTVGRVEPVHVYRAKGKFAFRRIYITDDPFQYQYLAVKGQVNDAPFLGHDAHEVMYEGPNVRFSFASSVAHLAIIDFEFATDNQLFVNDGYLPTGEVVCVSSTNLITASGFYPHTMFSNAFGLRWPTAGNFGGFLA